MCYSNAELRWLETILIERFGGSWRLGSSETETSLSLDDAPGKLYIKSQRNVFMKPGSAKPVSYWNARVEGLLPVFDEDLPAPGLEQKPEKMIEVRGKNVYLNYDILGLVLWMLCRIEEVGASIKDSHNRFPAKASHAYINRYLDRPIVDEWLFVLAQVIQKIWPDFLLKRHHFEMKVSHDVDVPSKYAFGNLIQFGYTLGSEIKRHRNWLGIAMAPWIRLNTHGSLHRFDPANTFDWIMDQSDRRGIKSAFYFVCGRKGHRRDPDYHIGHPAIRSLMRNIHRRGHEIGLHPSYLTYLQPNLLKEEAEVLKRVAREEGIVQTSWGGRMHYLRWQHPDTLRAWIGAGLDYDCSLSYADCPGFRCGTCFDYPAFDTELGKAYKFRIRPLIAMECSVILKQYMGLGVGCKALDLLQSLKSKCRAVSGSFTLLWHNSELTTVAEREMYLNTLFG
jgi:hypothetical protein